MSSVISLVKRILGKPDVLVDSTLISKVETLSLQGKTEEALYELNDFEKANYRSSNQKTQQFSKFYVLLMRSKIQTETGQSKEAINKLEASQENIELLNHPVLSNLIQVELANAYQFSGDLNKSTEIIDLAKLSVDRLRFFYKPHYYKHRARIYNLEGKVLRKKGQFVEAIGSLEESLETWEKVPNSYFKAETLNDLGIVYASMGETDAGLNYFNQCLKIYEELQNEGQLLKIYNNVGLLSWQTLLLDNAVANLNKALEISKRKNIDIQTASLLLNTGLIYQDQGRINDAQKNFEESLVLFEKLDNQPYIAQCLSNLAIIYGTYGDTDKALDYFNRALKIHRDIHNEDEEANTLSNLSEVYRMLGQYDRAFELLEESLALLDKTGNLHFQVQTLYKAIDLCMSMGKQSVAEEFLLQLEKLYKQSNNKAAEIQYKLSKAKILVSSDRVVKRAEAQTLYAEVADDTSGRQLHTIEAMLGLGELLLQELKISASEEALNEFKALIDRLDKFSRSSEAASLNQIPTMIQVLLLKSKLAIIDLNVEQAQDFLKEAQVLAADNKLNTLKNVVEGEQELIKKEMMKYKKMVDSNASLYERLQETQIENYLKRAESILKKR